MKSVFNYVSQQSQDTGEKATSCHGWSEKGGALLPSYGHKHAKTFTLNVDHITNEL